MMRKRLAAITLALSIGLGAVVSAPADAATADPKAETRYHLTYGSSKAWRTASKAERRHVRHAFARSGWKWTCSADMRHAYMDRRKHKDRDGIVKGIPVVQVKHAGKWYRFAEFVDGICGD